MKDLTKVLVRPLVTERSTELGEASNKFIFEVSRDACKPEIKHAVEKYFGVKVLDVRTLNMKGKPKRQGRFEGRRRDWKKAIITLGEGDTIDLFDVV